MAESLLGPSFCCNTSIITASPLLLFHNFYFPRRKSLSMSAFHCHCLSNSNSKPNPNPIQPSLLVFSGGTAFNGVVEELKRFTTRVAHVLPVSDDGGSTAEIVRVLGGPAVGDIRSRCLRLSDESTSEALAVRRLLGHRLPLDPQQAKSECIGNFFFAGARIFFQSLDAAIFLFSRVSDIPSESQVLPVISTNDRLTLGCELWDGMVIRGQNEISHPTNGSMEPVKKERSAVPELPSRIKRVFYMSSEGRNLLHEVLLGIGEIISSRSCPKVLLLNGSQDRETSGFSASCFVTAITDALNRTYGNPHKSLKNSPSQYINTILVPKDGEIPLDIQKLASQGIFDVIVVDSVRDPKVGVIFDPKSLIQAIADLLINYVRTNATKARTK